MELFQFWLLKLILLQALVNMSLGQDLNIDVRDFTLEEPFTRADRAHFRRSYFPTFKKCMAADFPDTNRTHLENRTLLWSSLANLHLFPRKESLTKDGKAFLDKSYSEDSGYLRIRFGIFIFFPLCIVVAAVSAVVIPVIGSILFWACQEIYYLMTNRLFRKIGRRILIEIELRRRQREITLIKMSGLNRRPPRPRFRLPKFFRNFEDEDVPEILQQQHGQVVGSSDSDDFDIEEAYAEVREEEAKHLHFVLARKHAERLAHERDLETEAEAVKKRLAREKRKKRRLAFQEEKELEKSRIKFIKMGIELTTEMKALEKKKKKNKKKASKKSAQNSDY